MNLVHMHTSKCTAYLQGSKLRYRLKMEYVALGKRVEDHRLAIDGGRVKGDGAHAHLLLDQIFDLIPGIVSNPLHEPVNCICIGREVRSDTRALHNHRRPKGGVHHAREAIPPLDGALQVPSDEEGRGVLVSSGPEVPLREGGHHRANSRGARAGA